MPDTLPPALLLDLDDTILSYSAGIEDTWREVVRTHASHLGAEGMQRLFDELIGARVWYWADPSQHRVGRLDLLETRRYLVRESLRRLGMPEDAVGNAVGDEYSRLRDIKLAPFPGAIETVHDIRKRGTKLALITNGNATMQRGKIDRFGLEPLFDCIIVEGEFGVGKPDQRVFLHALDTLQVAPHEAWMVGDNLEWDVAGPQAVGVKGIWMDFRGKGLPESSTVRPDRIINTLSELL